MSAEIENNTTVQNQSNQTVEPCSVRKQDFVTPYYEVTTTSEAYEVQVYLPGVSKQQTTVTLDKGNLIIEGIRQSSTNENWKLVSRELDRRDYKLKLEVKVLINEEQIAATQKDGILTVRLPVAEEAKAKQIAIS